MLLIIAAAPLETAFLRNTLPNLQTSWCEKTQLFSRQVNGTDILLSHSGIGQVNMTIQLTRLLGIFPPEAVFLCGCGGSYPESGLKIGDLALATHEFYADLGVATKERFIPLEELDLPQDPQLSPPIRQLFPLDNSLLAWAQKILQGVTSGRFATVNCCSGHPDLSLELKIRSGAICENMEGAAAAQVCAHFSTPLLELRGISNPTGTRDPRQWDIVSGAESAQKGILELLEHWPNN